MREQVVQSWVPVLLKGDFGPAYGTNHEVARRLRDNRGSLIDPTHFDPEANRGSGDYRLSKGFEEPSRAFRSKVPRTGRILVGLTPIPASLALRDHEATIDEMLATWSRWLEADGTLNRLPATLPDDCFATRAHLNARGVAEFTRLLADEIVGERRVE
jgi:hypothetical protein